MPPQVSVVITTYNRAHLLCPTLDSFAKQAFTDYEVVIIDDGDDAETPALCARTWPFNLRYRRLNRARLPGFNNPARPNNIGIRMSTGGIIVLQNAEVKHSGDEVIRRLVDRCDHNTAVFAQVEVLDDKNGLKWYCHKHFSPRPFFFCGALQRTWFEKLRGFDEDFKHYGYDDNDFADRLAACGVTFDFTDIETQHQWHPTSYDQLSNHPLYEEKKRALVDGKISVVRNLDHEWGSLD